MANTLTFDIERQVITSGYDRRTCWVHPRLGVIPPATLVVTMQKLLLTGMDVFYGLYEMRSDDMGHTWSQPVAQPGLARRELGDGLSVCPSDFWPTWHSATGTLLGTGHTCVYQNDKLSNSLRPRRTVWSVYDNATRTWADWQALDLAGTDLAMDCGAGSTQRVDLDNGDVLLPAYGVASGVHFSTVMRCGFDGKTLAYQQHGDLTAPEGDGAFHEPSLAQFDGRFFLTLRSNTDGFIAVSRDGLRFDRPQRWTYDDGQPLNSVSTQQHWITQRDGLYLVYCRRGPENERVFRYRAPLFIGQVDPDKRCIIRETERAIIPDRGATLGNFGTALATPDEAWVTDAEWMQHGLDAPWNDPVACEAGGSDNSVWAVRMRWGHG